MRHSLAARERALEIFHAFAYLIAGTLAFFLSYFHGFQLSFYLAGGGMPFCFMPFGDNVGVILTLN